MLEGGTNQILVLYTYALPEVFKTYPNGLVFVKDASFYFTSRGHDCRRREIVITSAKHEAERTIASEGAIYKT